MLYISIIMQFYTYCSRNFVIYIYFLEYNRQLSFYVNDSFQLYAIYYFREITITE